MLAKAAVLVNRGSATMIGALLTSFAVKMCCIEMGWASAAFEPQIKTDRLFRISGMELVMAPTPKTLARPATVVEWQIRAWLSTLLLPQKAASFRMAYAASLS